MQHFNLNDTIVGLATPAGSGVTAILRLSGPDCQRIVQVCLEPVGAVLGLVSNVVWKLNAWDRRVPVRVFRWRGNRSYTGQPTIEVHHPQNSPLSQALQAQVIEHGARLARPGEFTLRAFLAGRLDLVQAEAILGLIQADNLEQLHLALDQRSGGLSRPIQQLRSDLLDLLADVEAGLDFVDEDISFISDGDIERRLALIKDALDAMRSRMRDRGISSDLPRVVLIGPPNAGKSSLFNALLQGESALVGPEAGTTRDYVSRPLRLGDRLVELIDTAGIGPGSTAFDQLAGERRSEAVTSAALLLRCVPADQAMNDDGAQRPNELVVRTKVDLDRQVDSGTADCRTSALTGTGVEALKRQIAAALLAENRLPDATPYALPRAAECLTRAGDAIVEALRAGVHGHEYVAAGIRQSLAALGEIVGEVYTEDLLDQIFSRFCIGK